jgi:hypothetical protein
MPRKIIPKSDHTMTELEPRVKSLEDSVKGLQSSIADVSSKIDRIAGTLFDRVNEASKPNMANLAAWAMVVLGVVGLVGSLMGFFTIREFNRQDHELESLDSKLQREYTLINATTAGQIASVDKNSLERHDDAISALNRIVTKLDRLQEFQDSQVKADLQELRERRAKGNQ